MRSKIDANLIVQLSASRRSTRRRFFESPELVRTRGEAGVKVPEFLYLEELETG